MTLRDLIAEMRKQLKDTEEGDFGPEGRFRREVASDKYKPPPVAQAKCPPGTVRQRKSDGTSSCIALRGAKHY